MTAVVAQRAPARAPRPRSRARFVGLLPHALFAILALVFCAPYLAPGKVLLPTGLHTIPPWIGDAGMPGDRPTNELMADALVLTLPARMLNHESLRAGEIAFWNPRIYGGYPHLAMIQNNALYPPSALLDAIDPQWSMAASIALHLAIAGSLMFLCLCRLGVSPSGALVGGVAFELNGMFLIRASAPSYVFSGAWLPLLLVGAHAVARGGGLRAGLPLALGAALTVIGGHPQIASLAVLAAVALFAWEIGAELGEPPRPSVASIARRGGELGLLVALGIALVGYQVAPFVEFLRESSRVAVSLAQVHAAALPVPGLVQALVPDVFGHPVDGSYWFADLSHLLDGRTRADRFWVFNYSGENLFTGVAPLVLAAAAIARPMQPRVTAFFAALTLAALGILIGTPLLTVSWALIPGFAYSRPDRVLFLYMAAMSALAALGFDALLAGARRNRSRLAPTVAAVFVAELLWASRGWLFDEARRRDLVEWARQAAEKTAALPSSPARQALVAGAMLTGCLALMAISRRLGIRRAAAAWIVAIALPSLAFGWRFNPVQPAPRLGGTAIERAITERAAGGRVARLLAPSGPVLPANLLQPLGIDDVHGASAAGLERYLTMIGAFDASAPSRMKYFPAFRDPRVLDTPLLDLLAVRLLLSDRELPPPWQRVAAEDGFTLFENPRALPRFHVVNETRAAADVAEAVRLVASPGFDPRRTAVVVGGPSLPAPDTSASGDAATPAPAASVREVRREPHAIELVAETPRRAVLVTSEVAYPGWQARVDGEAREVLLVNAAFRGVEIPPGRHRVAFELVPRSFHVGVAISLAAALAIAGIALMPRRRREA